MIYHKEVLTPVEERPRRSLSTPLISIIIPTLQEEKLIAGTLGQFSFALRERFPLEVIVSDGGSSDGTLSKSLDKADLVVCSENGRRENIAVGRNRGARHAKGDVLMFFNADVRINDPERFFSQMIDAITRNGVAAATCNVAIYPEEETFVDRWFHLISNRYFRILNVLGMGMGRGECHVIRREVFHQVKGYDESLVAGEDYELFVRLRRLGRIAFLRNLTVYESPRRYRKFGYLRITTLWFLNAVAAFFFHRSFTKDWEPVR